ncbi:DUF5362 family protein [Flavihumibacter sp. CACIAM 22H1]|uniref:DUF5362 family protein n=1 Tax=Flavihumibacter sp. CACIAM 22H1 TaxID=1812911 RepID=UPI0007A88354|nr:DUF5362 family protein [Flavihumibacter sp. CACIAM 22H1]KYP15029.1 MAG: hypothetical protein A1D16_01160 [Flavihumibacter sp. CACIAM 22H1]
METPQTNLFDLQVDGISSSYLAETAKWAKFLSIIGFIVCGILVLAGIFMGSILSDLSSMGGNPGVFAGGGSIFISILYVAMSALYFFPCLYLYRFAVAMKTALQANDALQLQTSFKNLKSSFRFVGILTIILLSLYVLIFVGAGIFAAFSF